MASDLRRRIDDIARAVVVRPGGDKSFGVDLIAERGLLEAEGR